MIVNIVQIDNLIQIMMLHSTSLEVLPTIEALELLPTHMSPLPHSYHSFIPHPERLGIHTAYMTTPWSNTGKTQAFACPAMDSSGDPPKLDKLKWHKHDI
jgi:hypothetical protein